MKNKTPDIKAFVKILKHPRLHCPMKLISILLGEYHVEGYYYTYDTDAVKYVVEYDDNLSYLLEEPLLKDYLTLTTHRNGGKCMEFKTVIKTPKKVLEMISNSAPCKYSPKRCDITNQRYFTTDKGERIYTFEFESAKTLMSDYEVTQETKEKVNNMGWAIEAHRPNFH